MHPSAQDMRFLGVSVDLLGRPLGHCIFSLIGLKRILFTNIFSEALRGQPRLKAGIWHEGFLAKDELENVRVCGLGFLVCRQYFLPAG